MTREDRIGIVLLIVGLSLVFFGTFLAPLVSSVVFIVAVFSGFILVVISFYILILPRVLRQIRDISTPEIAAQVYETEVVLARPAAMIRMITRFGYLVLTKETMDFWAKDLLRRKGKRVLSVPLGRVEVAVDSGIKKAIYSQRLALTYTDERGKRVTEKFSFVRTWGATWFIPGLDVDVVRSVRVVHDFAKAGEWAEAYVKAVSEAKRNVGL